MFRNYFTVAWRNLVKSKMHSLINIAGLATGMAVAILIGLWIWNELSFNKQFRNYDRIARVMQNQTFDGEIRTWASQPMQLGPELRNTYGRYFTHVVMSSWTAKHTLSYGKKNVSNTGNYMEPGAPDMLTLDMLQGSRSGLNDRSSILLSRSVASALFGEDDPVNQIIKIDNKLDVKVTGVYKDLPYSSAFSELNFIAPWDLMVKSENLVERGVGWGNGWFQAFVQVADNAAIEEVSAKIKNVKLDKVDAEGAKAKPEVFLQPMSRWHLHSEFKNGREAGGAVRYLWMFGIIGAFVLLLACINFMNLSTARSAKRAREVGIRKAIGSLRGQLISQFFSESLLVTALAFILSLMLAALALPWFNEVAGKKMFLPWNSAGFWLAGLTFSFITGLVAGAYPALYLSSFKPVRVLKGVFKTGPQAAIPRKVLVVLQFTVSVTLIICTLVVFRQIQFTKDRPAGYDKNRLVTIPVQTDAIKTHYAAFRDELMQTGAVLEMARSESTGADVWVTNNGIEWEGKPPGMQDEFVTVGTDHHFGKTVNWTISQGRDFSVALASDSFGLVVNETAVQYMGFKNPVGQRVRAFGENYQVIGVVKDMVMQSPYEPVRPMFFYIDVYERTGFVIINMNPRMSTGDALAKIGAVFKKFDPVSPVDYRFADEEYGAKFREEERLGKLAGFFAGLAVFISCLGLFGMASFMAEQRTKEIGVRKVLGAPAGHLWSLLSKDSLVPVAISLLIAGPMAWYFMHGWLQNYHYRTGIAWWIFAAAGSGALVITLVTVSYQSIKAALVNPVKSLRIE